MTESQWLASTSPREMLNELNFLHDPACAGERVTTVLERHLSRRKLLLIAAGCCDLMLKTDRGKQHLDADFADRWYEEIESGQIDLVHKSRAGEAAFNWTCGEPMQSLAPQVAALLRCIVGNPWRPVTLPKTRRVEIEADIEGGYPAGYRLECPWLTPTVLRLAQTAYDSRDFALLPILADAMEEAGCENADMLSHCRGYFRCPEHNNELCLLQGPHVRGCWVADLILGRE